MVAPLGEAGLPPEALVEAHAVFIRGACSQRPLRQWWFRSGTGFSNRPPALYETRIRPLLDSLERL